MRRKLSFALGGLCFLLALAFYSLPARLIPAFLDGQDLQISGVSGTLLNGRAARAVMNTQAGPLHLGELRWRFEPASLLTLAPTLALSSEWGTQRIQLRISKTGETLYLRQVDVSISAALVRQFAPVALDGRLNLVFEELTLAPGRVHSAEGRIVWQDALWLAPRGARALGSYAGEVSTSGSEDAEPETVLVITTLNGPVYAQGTASLTVDRYATDIRLDGGEGPLDPGLAQALSLLATPEDNGYRLRLDGDLSTDL